MGMNPQEVLMSELLSLLVSFSLGRLFQVNRVFNALITDSLDINKVFNMEEVKES